MRLQARTTAQADLIAETGRAIAIRLENRWRKVNGRWRDVVVHVVDVSDAEAARLLRELADQIDGRVAVQDSGTNADRGAC